MKMVADGSQVKIHIIGRTEDGIVFSSTEGKLPLTMKVGSYKKVKGLNNALIGMIVSDKKSVVIYPENGFGTYDSEQLLYCKLSDLPQGIKRGDIFIDSINKKWIIRDILAEEGLAQVDGNHVLAGKKLIFDIELVEIVS